MQQPVFGVLSFVFTGVDERIPTRDASKPAAGLAIQIDDDLFSRAPFFDLDRAGIPNLDSAPAVLALRDFALETGIRHGVVFSLNRETIAFRVKRWPFRHGPGN